MAEYEIARSGELYVTSMGSGSFAIYGLERDISLLKRIAKLEKVASSSWCRGIRAITYHVAEDRISDKYLSYERELANRVLECVRHHLSGSEAS